MPLIQVDHTADSFEKCYGIAESELQEIGNLLMEDITGNGTLPQDQYSKELLCVCIVLAIPATAALYVTNNSENAGSIQPSKIVELVLQNPDKCIEDLKYSFFTKVYYDNASPLMKILRTLEQKMEEHTDD